VVAHVTEAPQVNGATVATQETKTAAPARPIIIAANRPMRKFSMVIRRSMPMEN
jgi:hypothetical protein